MLDTPPAPAGMSMGEEFAGRMVAGSAGIVAAGIVGAVAEAVVLAAMANPVTALGAAAIVLFAADDNS